MPIVQRIKGIPSHLPGGLQPGNGVKNFLVDKSIRGVMGLGLGVAKGYYYDKLVLNMPLVGGVGIEALVGIAGYLGAAVMGPGSRAGRFLERAGDAGMTTYLYSIGASWGADRAGRGIAVKPLPGGRQQNVVGVIPPRAKGAFLTPDDIARFAQAVD